LLQAQTFILDPADKAAEQRGDLAKEADNRLAEVGGRDDKNPLCHKARVWRIACALATDEPRKALRLSGEVGQLSLDEATLDAKLLGDYFHLALVFKDDKYRKNPFEQVRKEGLAWLKDKSLASFGGTPEGYGIAIEVVG